MPTTTIPPRIRRTPPARAAVPVENPAGLAVPTRPAPRLIASNFLALSVAEVVCRGTSFAVMLSVAKSLGAAGYGRIEFAFNAVFWLVLLVRDGCEVIAARELVRHPKLVRTLVNHVLAVKLVFAAALFVGLCIVGTCTLKEPAERALLFSYGLMLIPTALGIDYVYRGMERMGLVAVSLCVRTAAYALGVWWLVGDPSQILRVPACLAAGETFGIALVWATYARTHGLPRPVLGGRFLRVFLRRGRPVAMIQISQTVIGSYDVILVGLMSSWAAVGLYAVPHRMITAILTFGLIFQQVVFPSLARSWRDTADSGRGALDAMVRVLMIALVPVAIGTTLLAGPLMHLLLPKDYEGASSLLALGIWRAPLLTLAYLYQTALISLNREAAGVRLLLGGAIGSGPLVTLMNWQFGLIGASAAVVLTGLLLMLAGYRCLAREGRQPAWHHHAGRPLLASLFMALACLGLQKIHVLAAIAGGAVVYLVALAALGGLKRADLVAVLGRGGRDGSTG